MRTGDGALFSPVRMSRHWPHLGRITLSFLIFSNIHPGNPWRWKRELGNRVVSLPRWAGPKWPWWALLDSSLSLC